MKIVLPARNKAQHLAENPGMAQTLADLERHEGNAIVFDETAPIVEIHLDDEDNNELTGVNNDHSNNDNNTNAGTDHQREESNATENDTNENNGHNANQTNENGTARMCYSLLMPPPQN